MSNASADWDRGFNRNTLSYWACCGDMCETVAAVVENRFGHGVWHLPVCGDIGIRGIEESDEEARIAAEQGLREWRDRIVRLVGKLLGEAQ